MKLTHQQIAERVRWAADHPEEWEGGWPTVTASTDFCWLIVNYDHDVDTLPLTSHWHGDFCHRSAEVDVDGKRIIHSYIARDLNDCDDTCHRCRKPLTGDERTRCHGCELGGDDEAIEVNE